MGGDTFSKVQAVVTGFDPADGEIGTHAPGKSLVGRGEALPDGGGGGSIWEYEPGDLAAADETAFPAEFVVEHELEGGGLAGQESAAGTVLNFGFEATAADGADDAAIRKEQSFGAFFLRAGTFDGGDDGEGEGFAGSCGGAEEFVELRHRLFLLALAFLVETQLDEFFTDLETGDTQPAGGFGLVAVGEFDGLGE